MLPSSSGLDRIRGLGPAPSTNAPLSHHHPPPKQEDSPPRNHLVPHCLSSPLPWHLDGPD